MTVLVEDVAISFGIWGNLFYSFSEFSDWMSIHMSANVFWGFVGYRWWRNLPDMSQGIRQLLVDGQYVRIDHVQSNRIGVEHQNNGTHSPMVVDDIDDIQQPSDSIHSNSSPFQSRWFSGRTTMAMSPSPSSPVTAHGECAFTFF
jgi:hypothetical protein